MKKLFFFCLAVLISWTSFAGTPAAQATSSTYYVSSTTGNNRNDGSKGAPFKNLQKALDVADAGSTILVAEGNYYGLLNNQPRQAGVRFHDLYNWCHLNQLTETFSPILWHG